MFNIVVVNSDNPFTALTSLLAAGKSGMSASEFHGLMTGSLCAAGEMSQAARQTAYLQWLDESPSAAQASQLDALLDATTESLGDFSDLDLRLLLPDDDEPIALRCEALADWCSGFLSGFGAAVGGGTLLPEVSEILADYGQIARISEQIPEGEDNEADLMELHEYVRVSTIYLFAEAGGR